MLIIWQNKKYKTVGTPQLQLKDPHLLLRWSCGQGYGVQLEYNKYPSIENIDKTLTYAFKLCSYSSNDKMCRISDMDFYESWTNTFFKAGVTSYYQYKPGKNWIYSHNIYV